MKIEKVKISSIKLNPNNPRIIKDSNFEKLKKSIEEFPEMMSKRPIVVITDTDGKLMPLGGNMRLKALKELGFKEVDESWIVNADDWTKEQQNQFVIKDNVSFGDWDWDIISSDWNSQELNDWGLDVPDFATDVDYSILEGEDLAEQLSGMTNGVKKAIQIEFEAEHYEEAYDLVRFWRDKGGYVGGMIMEYLKSEKEKI